MKDKETSLKKCGKCREFKDLESFHKDKSRKDGKYSLCKQCKIEYCKKYNREHTEKITEYQRKYRKEHKKERIQYEEEHKKEMIGYQREYQQKNKKKRNHYLKIKRISDSGYKLNTIISCGIRNSLKNGKQGWHWESLVPYTLMQLKKHLKSTLSDGYSWKDFMQGKLHIDHILPKAIFKYEKPEDLGFQVCWGLDNLRLIPVEENLRKKAKLIKPFQKTFAIEIKLRNKCLS